MSESSLAILFREAERLHPDLMEPYSLQLADAFTAFAKTEIMREGLRETFRNRYPMSEEQWPTPTPAPTL